MVFATMVPNPTVFGMKKLPLKMDSIEDALLLSILSKLH